MVSLDSGRELSESDFKLKIDMLLLNTDMEKASKMKIWLIDWINSVCKYRISSNYGTGYQDQFLRGCLI